MRKQVLEDPSGKLVAGALGSAGAGPWEELAFVVSKCRHLVPPYIYIYIYIYIYERCSYMHLEQWSIFTPYWAPSSGWVLCSIDCRLHGFPFPPAASVGTLQTTPSPSCRGKPF